MYFERFRVAAARVVGGSSWHRATRPRSPVSRTLCPPCPFFGPRGRCRLFPSPSCPPPPFPCCSFPSFPFLGPAGRCQFSLFCLVYLSPSSSPLASLLSPIMPVSCCLLCTAALVLGGSEEPSGVSLFVFFASRSFSVRRGGGGGWGGVQQGRETGSWVACSRRLLAGSRDDV